MAVFAAGTALRAEAQGRRPVKPSAPSLEETPAEWLAFLGETPGPLPDNQEERTPTLLLYENGRLVWLSGTGTEQAAWKEATIGVEERTRLRGIAERAGLLKLRPESALPISKGARTTHLGISVGTGLAASRRVLRVRGLDQLAAVKEPDPLIKAAKSYRDALLALRPADGGRPYEPGVIRVWFRPVGSRGEFPEWPVAAPQFTSEGLAYYGGTEARNLIGILARYPRQRIGARVYQVGWSPALQMPGEAAVVANAAALKPTDPVSAQIRWDGPQDKPMPAFWLFANRPVPAMPRRAALLTGAVSGEAMMALHTATTEIRKREERTASRTASDGYTFAFERGGKALPGFTLSRAGSTEAFTRLAASLKSARVVAPGLQDQVQAALRRLAA